MTKEMTTRISEVTVFRDGARITRSGKTELIPGEHVVRITGISEYAHDDSFRVKGKGAAILRGIDVKKTSSVFEPPGELKEMKKNLEVLEKKRIEISDSIQYQESRAAHLSSIMQQFSAEFGKWFAAGESTMDHLSTMDKTTLKLLSDAKKKQRELRDELEKLVAEIQVLHRNIQRVQGQMRTITTTNVNVTMEVRENTRIELEVTYQIGGAGWSPTYDVDIGENTASVKRIAQISNRTLEDWKDIELVVSTASARPVEAVEPTPFYVDVYKPYAMEGSTSSGFGGMRAAKMDMAKEDDNLDDIIGKAYGEEPMVSMTEAYAEATETLGGTVIYDVPGKLDIPSDDDPHPVTLTEEEFESRRLHFWNAYAMPEVVAQDEITNGDSVLLPGNVKVYATGDFIGETNLSLIAPREKFRLGTRISYDVKAEKKLVEKDTEKAGFTRSKKRRGYRYKLELKNFSKDTIEIRIVDRIPYSSSEKIAVDLKSPSLIPKKIELGVIEWETSIESQKELAMEYSFEVEWEKEVSIRPPLP